MKKHTMSEIRKLMDNSGSHWFDDDTMHFFKTELGEVFNGIGGTYFVTSDKPPHGKRQYSVRRFYDQEMCISTAGEFCSMSKTEANKQAKQLSNYSTILGN